MKYLYVIQVLVQQQRACNINSNDNVSNKNNQLNYNNNVNSQNSNKNNSLNYINNVTKVTQPQQHCNTTVTKL